MHSVVVYVRSADPYSVRLIEFLRRKGVRPLVKHVSDEDPDTYLEMVERTGESEPPQLLIDGEHVGDYERVTSLDLQGKFDELLED